MCVLLPSLPIIIILHHTAIKNHLWPISWATVKATGSPESSLMLQLRCGWQIPDRWDRPSVSQGWFIPAQMSFLGTKANDVHANTNPTSKYNIYPFSLIYWYCWPKNAYVCVTCLVTNTATSWWAGWVSLWGLRFFCQAQKLAKVVSAWWTIFNSFCNKSQS